MIATTRSATAAALCRLASSRWRFSAISRRLFVPMAAEASSAARAKAVSGPVPPTATEGLEGYRLPMPQAVPAGSRNRSLPLS